MIRGTSDSMKHRLPCTSSVRHRSHITLDDLAALPAPRTAVPDLLIRAQPTTISTFSGARSLRGHRSIYVRTTTTCAVSRISSQIDPLSPAMSRPQSARTSNSAPGRYTTQHCPLLDRHAARIPKTRIPEGRGEPGSRPPVPLKTGGKKEKEKRDSEPAELARLRAENKKLKAKNDKLARDLGKTKVALDIAGKAFALLEDISNSADSEQN